MARLARRGDNPTLPGEGIPCGPSISGTGFTCGSGRPALPREHQARMGGLEPLSG